MTAPAACTTALIVLLPIFVAIVLYHSILFTHVDRPPTDFGSGFMFDNIAGRYDFVNRVLALGMDIGWRQRMVSFIQDSIIRQQQPPDTTPQFLEQHDTHKHKLSSPPPRIQILDVATGTADVAILLAQSMPDAAIVGIDPSEKMLAVGRRKIHQKNLTSHIRLEVRDAMQLLLLLQDQDRRRWEPSSFDAATMAFGIRNVPDRARALCQIHHVLKPNAVLGILEFSEPDDSFGWLGQVARLFIRHVIPFLGGILSGAPREYWHLQNSIAHFPTPAEFCAQLKNLQCENGGFAVMEVIQMNYGSVQLYEIRVLGNTPPDASE